MFRDKLKQFIKSNQGESEEEGNNKKKIENLVFFVVLLIITIVIINLIWNGNSQTTKQDNNTSSKQLADSDSVAEVNSTTTADDLSNQLETILSKIQGVGEVKVFINYSESSEVVAMYNETSKTSNTEESDTSGGTRTIQETDSQKEIVYQENDGEKTPITQKVIQPKVEGAIITAKGAGNVEVKTNIIQAVEAVTGLATHKIQVFEMN